MSLRFAMVGLGGVILAGAAFAQDAPTLPDGDPAAGQKVAGMCRTCHGLDGVAQIPIAPNIGGEPAAYLADQLLAFRSGAREHEMMTVVAAGLSDQQIADVAAWYGAHTAAAVTPDGFDPAAAPELCATCHGPDGIALTEGVPHLAGENAVYIETQLKAFRSGKRPSEIMGPIAADLSDEDIRDAAEWYADVGLEVAAPN